MQAMHNRSWLHTNARQWIYIALPLFCLVACQPEQEAPSGPRPALVMTISQTGTQSGSVLVGEIKARYESAQAFRVAGKIVKRMVEVGQAVKPGQILARLDGADSRLNVAVNQADIQAAEAQLQLAKSNLERQRQLIDKKFISASALDSYEAQYQSALARLKQTQAQTAVSGNQARYTDLVADRAGFVSAIRAEPGQVVAAGEVIANIQDLRELEAHIPMPESRITGLQVGDAASLRLWAERETQYQAKIREIAPAADPVTRTFLVKLSILNPDSLIKPGMTAGVTFTRGQPDLILVPNTAVSAEGQNAQVWVVDEQQKVHPRKVTVASYREDGTVLSAGLVVGDRIVVAGVQALNEGLTIRPITASILH